MYHAKLFTSLTFVVFLFRHGSAHFLLNYPNSVGFDDDKEGTAPCGSFDVTFDNATDFHVDGDAVALTSTHPKADWLFRATLDKTATGNNWTNLLPDVSQSGLGQFCEPSLTVPANWAGQSGIVQIIQHGDDGVLYQCAAIHYVAGKASSIPPSCKNATGLSASFTADPSLPASTAAATSEPSGSTTMSGSSTMSATPAPSSSATTSDGVAKHQSTALGPVIFSVVAATGLAAIVMGLSCI